MLQKVKFSAWMVIIITFLIGFAGIAWQTKATKTNKNYLLQDTVPKKEKIQNDDETVIDGDINKAMEEANRAMLNLEKQLQHKDWEKMHKDLLKAQTELNAQKIQEQVERAMKEMDLQKIQLQTQEALQKIDWEKIQQEMQKAQLEIRNNFDSKKMDEQINRAMEESKRAMAQMKTFDMQKIQLELEKAKENLQLNQGQMQEQFEKAQQEINKSLHIDLKKQLEKAKIEVDRATEELRNYKEMFNEMDKDGLIKSKEEYKIQYKNGDLFIDGAKQPDAITNKYRHYFKKENVTIQREKDDDDNKIIHL